MKDSDENVERKTKMKRHKIENGMTERKRNTE